MSFLSSKVNANNNNFLCQQRLSCVCVKILVSNTFMDIFIACCKTAFDSCIAKDLELLERRKYSLELFRQC